MKEKGWIVVERATTDRPWTGRFRNFAPTKKDAIARYERTTGAYEQRTGNFTHDAKLGLAKVVRCEFSTLEED